MMQVKNDNLKCLNQCSFFYFLIDFNDLNISFFVIHSTFSLYFQI